MSQPRPNPRRTRAMTRVFEELGLEVIDVSVTGGDHLAFRTRLRTLSGDHEKTFIAANSPSDHRGDKNFAKQVRRWITSIDL